MDSTLSQGQPYMSGNTERDENGQFESELGNEDIMSYFAERRPFHTVGCHRRVVTTFIP